jgi:hypothetical protein
MAAEGLSSPEFLPAMYAGCAKTGPPTPHFRAFFCPENKAHRRLMFILRQVQPNIVATGFRQVYIKGNDRREFEQEREFETISGG